MKNIELTIEEWDKLADDPFEYYKVKLALTEGWKVALKDHCGVIFANLKIGVIDDVKYVYKDLLN